jgi:hypothetical protein
MRHLLLSVLVACTPTGKPAGPSSGTDPGDTGSPAAPAAPPLTGTAAPVPDAAPVAPGLAFDPAAPAGGDTLTLIADPPAVDPEGDPLVTTVTWYADGSLNPAFADLWTVDGRYVHGGQVWRAVVTVSDGTRDPVVAEASVTVSNLAPTVGTPVITPATPVDTDDLRVSVTADDADGGAPDVVYTWYRDGVEATDVGSVATVPAAATTTGEVWTVTVAATDGTDTTTVSSSPVTIIPWDGYVAVRTIQARFSPDGAAASGTWSLHKESHGARKGENACDLLWSFTGTDAATYCPTCTFAFDAVYTVDPSSTVTTGSWCTAMDDDGVGWLSYDDPRRTFFGMVYPPIGATTYGYTDWASFYGDGAYYSNYAGNIYAKDYTVTTSVDTAGYTTVTAYEYAMRRY